MIECQRCGEQILPVNINVDVIVYHKQCWVEFQQELIAVARGKTWRKIGQTTEYYEEDDKK